ncbi:hypothetical protein, partial [uncultured Pontibacter sp.]|uniref:hypothetical protein n=1 Tax=uncultured Pontibacter sp. TaxID=453356 RepID=UPI002607C197
APALPEGRFRSWLDGARVGPEKRGYSDTSNSHEFGHEAAASGSHSQPGGARGTRAAGCAATDPQASNNTGCGWAVSAVQLVGTGLAAQREQP